MKKLNKIELNSLINMKEDIIKKIKKDEINNKIILMDSLKLNTLNKILSDYE